MVHRRNIQTKSRSSSKKASSLTSMVKQTPSENLDDETKLAKRHLTKEMWQLVSIAVKRMADELVSISNNQQASTIPTETNKISIQSSLSSKPQPLLTTNTGAGDISFVKEKSTNVKEPIQRRTLPIQMLESSLHIKKKGITNNAKRRSIKSKVQKKSSKKTKKPTQRLRNNSKLK